MTNRWFGVVGFALVCASRALAQCPQWTAAFAGPGPNEPVRALTEFDDGTGNAVHAAGLFTLAGATQANHVARWNGSKWSALGTGTNDNVEVLCVSSVDGAPALYAGGVFTTAGGVSAPRIARWNGSSWSALGSGVSGKVESLVEFDDGGGIALYACGLFQSAGGAPANRVARWRSGAWSALGAGLTNDVRALAVHDDGSGPKLYAAGTFAGGVAVWDGTSWSAVGSGLTGNMYSLASFAPVGQPARLYVGRENALSPPALLRWDGVSWTSVGNLKGRILALRVIDDHLGRALWIGRNFAVSRYDGTNLTTTSADNFVWAVSGYDDGATRRVYAGGGFLQMSSLPCNFVASRSSTGWEAVGESTQGLAGDQVVTDIEEWTPPGVAAPQTFVCGAITKIGNLAVQSVARWNGHAWASVGLPTYASVLDLVPVADPVLGGPALFAVGDFYSPGLYTGVARWDGASWTAIPGADGFWLAERAVVFRVGGAASDTLVISGYFNPPFGSTAAWNGTTWSALGSGLGFYPPRAMVAYDPPGPQGEGLYCANASGIGPARVERWDGTSWSVVVGGNTPFYAVESLHVWDDGSGTGPALYAAARNNVGVTSVYRWNGATWTIIGPPANAPSTHPVLAHFDDGNGDALYVGSRMRWRGGQWTTYSTDLANDEIEVMRGFASGSAFGRALVIGGHFASVGSVASARIARWSDPCATLTTYCTAKINSQGCTPAIGWSGEPSLSLSATTPFTITASNVLNQKGGLLYFGAAGRSTVPFQGGFKCVRFPALRTPPRSSGGNVGPDDCSGAYSIDFTPWLTGSNNELLSIGVTVDAQWWSRDPASASTVGLTDALEFEIRP